MYLLKGRKTNGFLDVISCMDVVLKGWSMMRLLTTDYRKLFLKLYLLFF
jgi:hypothetical protein